MSKDVASNHSATCRHLLQTRKLRLVEANPQFPKEVEVCFSGILSLCGVTQKSTKKLKIKEVLSKSYNREEDFDEALFNAMQTDLKKNGVKIERNGNMIIVKSSISVCDKYAFGFSRQAKGKYIFKQESEQEKDSTVSDVMDDRASQMHSEYDHVCCLFEREDSSDEWKVKDCFSVVELKMSNTSSKIQLEEDLLTNDPIVQEIDYVLESTWRSICRNGLGSDLPLDFLPVAMVAAHRSGCNKASRRKRWVKASMFIPVKAGGSFYVEPNGSEDFTGEETESIQHAAGLYLETMLFGLKLCQECKRRNWKPCSPSAMSGSSLFFGDIELEDAELCGSPLFTREKAVAEGFFHVSQGELYRVKKLTVNADLQQDDTLWLIAEGEHDYQNLLVKVWSVSVHDCLQSPLVFSQSIQKLVHSRPPDLIKELSTVLLGIFETSTGTIALMQEIKGKPVCLKSEPSKISDYWREFEVLVEKVLLPLAKKNIIYQDLRPGFDVTSNILRVGENEETKIRLIDFESLCSFRLYSNKLDKRYPRLPMKRGSNTYNFLHCQIAGIAYAWIKKISRDKFVMKDAVDWVRNEGGIQYSESEQGIEDLLKWLKDRVTEAQVKEAQVSAAPQHAPAPVPASSTGTDPALVTYTGKNKNKKKRKTGS